MTGPEKSSLKKAVIFSSKEESPQETFSETEKIDELSGKMGSGKDLGLMHSVLENDKKSVGAAKLLSQALNYRIPLNINSIFEELISNYKLAKQLYGKTFIREISGFSEEYIDNNRQIPEFQHELKKRIEEKINFLKKNGLIEDDSVSEKGLEIAAYINYIEEIDTAYSKGFFGKKASLKRASDGERQESHFYKKDRYKDIDLSGSVKIAIRRGHDFIDKADLKASERKSRGSIRIAYCLDASGSMTGEKIGQCKKAGIALCYKALSDGDQVGLVVFGKEVKKSVPVTKDIQLILKEIMAIRPYGETDISIAIEEAVKILSTSEKNSARHIIIITDAMPTSGKSPEEDTVKSASIAKASGATISIVGIKLDKKAEALAEKVVRIGAGRFYRARGLSDIDRIVLEDYYNSIE